MYTYLYFRTLILDLHSDNYLSQLLDRNVGEIKIRYLGTVVSTSQMMITVIVIIS